MRNARRVGDLRKLLQFAEIRRRVGKSEAAAQQRDPPLPGQPPELSGIFRQLQVGGKLAVAGERAQLQQPEPEAFRQRGGLRQRQLRAPQRGNSPAVLILHQKTSFMFRYLSSQSHREDTSPSPFFKPSHGIIVQNSGKIRLNRGVFPIPARNAESSEQKNILRRFQKKRRRMPSV